MLEFAKRKVLAGALAAAALLVMGTLAIAADAPYTISVANGKAKVGVDGTIKVTVKAAEGWHANFRYQHRIENLAGEKGVEIAFKSVRASKAAGRDIVYLISAKPTAAGEHKVTGSIMFSVSKGKETVTKSVPLAATITGEKAGS